MTTIVLFAFTHAIYKKMQYITITSFIIFKKQVGLPVFANQVFSLYFGEYKTINFARQKFLAERHEYAIPVAKKNSLNF